MRRPCWQKRRLHKLTVIRSDLDATFFSLLQDLIDIGIETHGHRMKLLREIGQLPLVELDNNVPVSLLEDLLTVLTG